MTDLDSARAFAKDNDYQLMAKILEDGAVSRDEYTESYGSWTSCMEDAGTVFSMPSAMWNPTSNQELIRAWTVNPPSDTKDAQAVCWNQYNFVKQEFQDQTASRTDPQLMTYVIDCIEEMGGPTTLTPAINFEELSYQSEEIIGTNPTTPIPDCVDQGIFELYPGLQGYSLAF